MLSLHFIWAGCETDSGGELELGLAEGTGTADFVDKSRVVQVIPDEGSTVASHTIMSSNGRRWTYVGMAVTKEPSIDQVRRNEDRIA